MGGITNDRGGNTFIKIVEALHDHIRLDLIGEVKDANLYDKLLTLSEQYPESLRLHGFVSPEQGWEIAGTADIGLSLLKPIRNYKESLPTKVLEYYALGLVPLMNDFEINKKISAELGQAFLVNHDKTTDILNLIENLITQKELGKLTIDQVPRIYTSQYSWEHESKKLLNFIQDLK